MLCQAPTCFEIADRLTCVLTCKYALFLGQLLHVFGGPPFRLFLLVELSEIMRKQITKRDILPFPGWRPEQQAWLECWRWRQGLHSPLPLPAAEQGGRLPTITLQFVFLTNTSKILVFRFPSPTESPSSSPKLAPPLFLNSSATSLQPFALMRSDMSRHCHWCAQHNIIMHFILSKIYHRHQLLPVGTEKGQHQGTLVSGDQVVEEVISVCDCVDHLEFSDC